MNFYLFYLSPKMSQSYSLYFNNILNYRKVQFEAEYFSLVFAYRC